MKCFSLSVFHMDNSNCHHSVSSKPKYFLTKTLTNKKWGSVNNPCIFEAPKGQRLKTEIMESQKASCNYVDIILHDDSTRKNFSLCENSYQMPEGSKSNSFISSSNVVKMFIKHLDSDLEMILIKFQGYSNLIIYLLLTSV